MKNMEVFLVVFCLLVMASIAWIVVSSNFIELVVGKHVPISVFWEYVSASSFFGTIDIAKCATVENGTIYLVDRDASPILNSAYFDINGVLVCRTSAHADRIQITEGTSCPQTIACENIAVAFRD